MHVLPNTEMIFINNTASQFGGAIAAENFRAGNDTALILNNFCFIQYDIGGEHEYKPDNWKVKYLLCTCVHANINLEPLYLYYVTCYR